MAKYGTIKYGGGEEGGLYGGYTRVGKANTFIYNLPGLIVKILTAKYHLYSQVLKTATIKFNLYAIVSNSRTALYNLFGEISRSLTVAYGIYNQVLQPITLKYNLMKQVLKQLVIKYNIWKILYATGTFFYHLLNNLGLWNPREEIEDDGSATARTKPSSSGWSSRVKNK